MKYLMNDNGEMYQMSAHKQPTFKELKNKEWILWGYSSDYDDKEWNNRQPDYYEWLYNSSSKHRTIVNKKVAFICGQGLYVDDNSLSNIEKVEAKVFAAKINDSELIKKLTLNLTKIGGFCFEVIADKAGQKIEPHYINIKNVRRSKVEYDEQGRKKDCVYYYTCDWAARKPEENPDFTTFYEWKWDERPDNNKRYLVYYSEDEENLYPIPEYTASVPYIAADYEISNFTYNNVKNGFSAGWLVNFYNGEPKEEEKAEIAGYWKHRLHGSDNSGEPVLAFNDIGVDGVNITPLNPNGQDDRFINLNKQIREEIFSGHAVDPVVVGLEGNNGFNNNADEKRTATEDFQAFYVRGKQAVLEQYVNAIRLYNEIKGNLKIRRLAPLNPQFTSSEIMQIATLDEVRDMNGLAKSKTEANVVADALGTISPLVATKVLETMTPAEIRSIVGLNTSSNGVQVKDPTKTIEKEFTSDDKIIGFLSGCGIKDEELQVISSHELFAKDIEDAEAQEQGFLSSLEIIILKLLMGNPALTLDTIAKSVKRPVSEIEPVYNDLIERGLIDEDGVTEEGEGELNEEPEIFTVYKYALRSDVSGGDIIDTTRDFCKRLVRLSRTTSWTLEDIKRMNNGMGLDVFRSRGGWRTLPDGNHVPFCRHIWKAEVVRRK